MDKNNFFFRGGELLGRRRCFEPVTKSQLSFSLFFAVWAKPESLSVSALTHSHTLTSLICATISHSAHKKQSATLTQHYYYQHYQQSHNLSHSIRQGTASVHTLCDAGSFFWLLSAAYQHPSSGHDKHTRRERESENRCTVCTAVFRLLCW